MRHFHGEDGREWTATAKEEATPRHHGRWYLVLHAEADQRELSLPEVRWQTRQTAERTLATMSEFELQRRLRMAARRHETPGLDRSPFGQWLPERPGAKGGTAAG